MRLFVYFLIMQLSSSMLQTMCKIILLRLKVLKTMPIKPWGGRMDSYLQIIMGAHMVSESVNKSEWRVYLCYYLNPNSPITAYH